MSEYFCAGYTVLTGGKKGLQFFLIEDNVVNEEKILLFSTKKKNDYPVGFVIEINKTKEGRYCSFKYLNSGENINGIENLKAKYRTESIANVKYIDFEKLKKKQKSIRETIEKMTIKELLEWSRKNHMNKRMIKFYLYELF